VPFAAAAQDFASTSDLAFNPEDVTFNRDIAPILQRSSTPTLPGPLSGYGRSCRSMGAGS
jgi:hypothetical protein